MGAIECLDRRLAIELPLKANLAAPLEFHHKRQLNLFGRSLTNPLQVVCAFRPPGIGTERLAR